MKTNDFVIDPATGTLASEIRKDWEEMEGRVLRKIRRKMRVLARDKKLKEEMEKEINETLNKKR